MKTTANLEEHNYGFEIRDDNGNILYELPSMYADMPNGKHHCFCIPIYEDVSDRDDYDYSDYTFLSIGYGGIAEGLTNLMLNSGIAVPIVGIVGRSTKAIQEMGIRAAANEGRLFLKKVD